MCKDATTGKRHLLHRVVLTGSKGLWTRTMTCERCATEREQNVPHV
jgi:hypothetical protein